MPVCNFDVPWLSAANNLEECTDETKREVLQNGSINNNSVIVTEFEAEIDEYECCYWVIIAAAQLVSLGAAPTR